jgi:MFS family permease
VAVGWRGRLPLWLAATLLSQFFVQLTVSLSRPVSSYRLLALGADATAVGVVAASFALLPMVLAVGLGRFTDRRRPGVVLVMGASLTTVAALLLSRAGSVLEVGIWTALLGIGHLCVVVGAQSIVAYGDVRGDGLTGFGLLTMSAAFGQIAGPFIGGLLAQSSGPSPTLASTGQSLLVAALFCVLALPFAVLTLRVRPAGPHGAAGAGVGPQKLRGMLRIHGMPAALLASFGAKGSLDLVTAYLPLLGIELGLRASTVGLLLSLCSAASLAARMSMPWLVRRTRTVRLMAVTTLASGICVALLPLGRDVVLLATVMVVLGYLLALSQTVTMVWVVGLASPRSRGSALGMRLASNRVGQVAVPGLAGLLSGSAGVTAVFYLLATVLGVIAGVIVRTSRDAD